MAKYRNTLSEALEQKYFREYTSAMAKMQEMIPGYTFDPMLLCPRCSGSGQEPGTTMDVRCYACQGRGIPAIPISELNDAAV